MCPSRSDKHMTSNGNSVGSTGKNSWSHVRKELGGFGIAEIVAEGTWLGTAAIITMIPEKILHDTSMAIGKVCVEPFLLDPLEKVMHNICHLKECQPDETKSREERAANLVRAMIIFAPSMWASLEVKNRTRRYLNNKMNIPHFDPGTLEEGATLLDKLKHYAAFKHWSPDEKMIAVADEGVLLGSMYVMNNQMAPVTDDLIRNTSSMIQKTFGTSERKAHDYATAAVVWSVPNAVGGLGAAMAIASKHFLGWPKGWVGKILGQKDQNAILPPSH